jgi:2-keto-4-pentenoate hydratase/2-oxohepta-3-ene-1,7-dioic acid hydratase in catechol pathway
VDSSRRDFFQKTTFAAATGLMIIQAGANAAGEASPQTQSQTPAKPHKMIKGLTILSIRQKDGAETLGVKTISGVIDVRSAVEGFKMSSPMTLDDLLQNGRAAELEALVAAATSSKDYRVDEGAITYGRLFQNPGKIVCVGLNYRRHAQEIGMQPPRVPPLFNKYNNALAPHRCTIPVPDKAVSTKLDYETELLIVMGKRAWNVSEADALNYVAGYCTAQDFSARDLQLALPGGQWMIGKTLDNFAPIGPYFVSADLIPNPNNLKIETRVNGGLRQSSNTSDFIFNCQQMISYISRHFPLEAGDIIFTGTPEGVIQGKPKDQQVWLKAGDQIESSIERLGSLTFSLA